MDKYKLFKSKTFESLEKFEQRLNQECSKSWRVVSMVSHGGLLVAVLEKVLL